MAPRLHRWSTSPKGRHAAPTSRRAGKPLVVGGGLLAGALVFAAAAMLINQPDAVEETAAPAPATPSPATAAAGLSTTSMASTAPTSPVAASPARTSPAAKPTTPPEAMSAEGTCISTACRNHFKKTFKIGAGNVSTKTVNTYLEYAENMCDALSQGDQAVDLRDSALRYNGFDELAFTITFASATEAGSLCPEHHDQMVQLRN